MPNVLDIARQELLDAAHWYEDQEAGLGDRLVDASKAALARIDEWPEAWPEWELPGLPSPVRHIRLTPFPYVAVYMLEPTLLVIAFVHTKRRPGHWIDRLNSI